MKRILKFCLAAILAVTTVAGVAACETDKSGEKKEYNIIVTSATIPVVMAMLDTIDSKLDTYMWFGRKGTFNNIDAFEALDNFHLVAKSSWSDASNIPMSAVDEMANTVMDLYVRSNKEAKFNLYVTDYGFEVAMRLFDDQEIPEKNYRVCLLEDGTGSYSQFISTENYAAADGSTRLKANIEAMNDAIAAVRNGSYTFSAAAVQNWKMCFPYSTRENVEYWLQYPELLTSQDAEMQKMLDEHRLHLVKKNLTEVYKKMSKENQDKFKNIVFDVAELDKIIKQNDKKTLVFTGTSYSGKGGAAGSEELGFVDEINSGEFEAVMDKVIELYGEEYNIVYKPHPSWDVYADSSRWTSGDYVTENGAQLRDKRKKYLEDNDIKTIPGQIPMEVIIWAYSDVIKMGGYNSSLYMNGNADSVLFFVLGQNDYSGISFPMNLLIEKGVYDNKDGNKPLIICPATIASLKKASA